MKEDNKLISHYLIRVVIYLRFTVAEALFRAVLPILEAELHLKICTV
jgi:hypothetical protein